MEWGKHRSQLVELYKTKRVVPEALTREPDLPPILQELVTSFFALHARRGYSMGGELPLTVEAIAIYAKIHGFDLDLKFFYRCMCACDDVFFDTLSKQREQKKPVQKPKAR